jgi:hypothetical protein
MLAVPQKAQFLSIKLRNWAFLLLGVVPANAAEFEMKIALPSNPADITLFLILLFGKICIDVSYGIIVVSICDLIDPFVNITFKLATVIAEDRFDWESFKFL